MRQASSAGLVAAAIATIGITLGADVKTSEKSAFKMEGPIGRVVGLFSKTARDGTTATVAVKGDRKMTRSGDRGEIIDLGAGKVYTLDFKRNTYVVATFEQLRQQMEDARRRAEADARKAQAKGREPQRAGKANGPQIEIGVTLRETGQKKSLNGFNAREVVMTIVAHEKGKPVDTSGGLVVTSDMWLAPAVPALKEIVTFDARYARRLATAMLGGASPADAAAISAVYPMMKDVTIRMNAEQAKLTGVSVQTSTAFDAVQSPEAAAEQAKQSDRREPGASGLVGGLAGRLARKKTDAPVAKVPTGHTRFVTMTHEILSVGTNVAAADVALPQGFKEKR